MASPVRGFLRHARAALRGFEGAEADECHRVAFLERARHSLEHRFNRRRGAALRRAGVLGNRGDQIVLVHLRGR